MLIAQFHPDPNEASLASGFSIARGAALRSILGKGDDTACDFRTAHEVKLWPLEIAGTGPDRERLEVSHRLPHVLP